jgi:tRNA threonylcarbamoyladenosine biosynthesis protein TsaE
LTQTENYPASFSPADPDKIHNTTLDLPAEIICSSRKETFSLGKELSRLLKKGSVVALKGPLGAGKTCIAKGIAAGLGVKEKVTSPSYTIICEYEGVVQGDSVRIYHIDAYRLAGNDDFSAIGGEEIVFGDGISIIEWSERIPDFISAGALRADIQIMDAEKRHFHIYWELKNEYSCP